MGRNPLSCAVFIGVSAFGAHALAEVESERVVSTEVGSSSRPAAVARASERSDAPKLQAPAETPASPHALFGDFGLNFHTQGASLTMFTGYRYAAFRVGPLVNAGLAWYDWVNFYGAALGPVFELPMQFNVALLAGAGWQVYHFERCNQACMDAGVDDSRLAFEGRVSLGRTFALGRRGTRLVVSGAFTVNYSSRREVAVPSGAQPSNEFPSSGGYHPGGLLSVGFDLPL